MESGRLRVGLVGAGVISKRLGSSFNSCEHTRITAVCDINQPAAVALASQYKAAVVQDYEALCESPDVDLVYVGVPPSLHCQVVLKALQCGKHVLCEKPLALSDKETSEMIQAARASPHLVCAVNMPLRYVPAVHKFKELVAAGYLGQLARVQIVLRFPEWPRRWQQSKWLECSFEGGALREVGTHFFFTLSEIFPEKVVRANALIKYDDPAKAEVGAWGLLEQQNGIATSVDLLTGVACPEENSITAIGSKGALTLTQWRVLKGRTIADVQGSSDNWTTFDTEDVDVTAATVADVVAAVRASKEQDAGKKGGTGTTIVTFESAARANCILNALLQSNGQWVDVAAQ